MRHMYELRLYCSTVQTPHDSQLLLLDFDILLQTSFLTRKILFNNYNFTSENGACVALLCGKVEMYVILCNLSEIIPKLFLLRCLRVDPGS